MTIPKRTGVAASSILAVVILGWLPIVAQEPASKTAPAPAAKKKQDPSRRVPPYFGQIGLTTEQRASIYGIQGKRHEKLNALEKQIAEEKAAMLVECETVLTDTQKKLLGNLRAAAAEPAAKPTAAVKPSN